MRFKEQLARDLDVFLNVEEFSDMVELDGVKMKAQITYQTAHQGLSDIAHKQGGFYIHPDLHGVNLIGSHMTIHFKTKEYERERGRIPKHTEYTRLNGKRYKVIESQETQGITRLILETDSMNTPRQSKMGGIYDV